MDKRRMGACLLFCLTNNCMTTAEPEKPKKSKEIKIFTH